MSEDLWNEYRQGPPLVSLHRKERTAMTDKPVEVIQSDRDMAAQHLPKFSPTEPHDVRAGKRDDHWLVQAFARYRLQLTDKADLVHDLVLQLEALSPDALEVVCLDPDAKRLLAILTDKADREPTAQMGGEEKARAYSYAVQLLGALWAKHFPEREPPNILSDTVGVLTQIDNLTTALVRPETPQATCNESLRVQMGGEEKALRKQIGAAISDPGATQGHKGERSLTEWQVDAVMPVVLAALRISARDEAIEECAKVADRYVRNPATLERGSYDEGASNEAKWIAAAIRNLKAGER